MATRKMSKEIVRRICEAVIDRRFFEENKALEAEKHKTGEKVQEFFDKKYSKLYKEFPELFETSSINLLDRYFVVSLRVPIGYRNCSFSNGFDCGYHKLMGMAEYSHILSLLQKHVENSQKLKEKRSRALSELKSFVSQYTTIKKLLEAAPELSEYLGVAGVKIEAETGNALTVTYDSVKDLIIPLRSEK